jgi:hypothetical protein
VDSGFLLLSFQSACPSLLFDSSSASQLRCSLLLVDHCLRNRRFTRPQHCIEPGPVGRPPHPLNPPAIPGSLEGASHSKRNFTWKGSSVPCSDRPWKRCIAFRRDRLERASHTLFYALPFLHSSSPSFPSSLGILLSLPFHYLIISLDCYCQSHRGRL